MSNHDRSVMVVPTLARGVPDFRLLDFAIKVLVFPKGRALGE